MPASTRSDWTPKPLPKSTITYTAQDGEPVVVDLRPMLGNETPERIEAVLRDRLGRRFASVDHEARTVTVALD